MEFIQQHGFRYFWFLIELVAIGLLVWFVDRKNWRRLSAVFITCFFIGLLVDFIGLEMKLWYYPRIDRTAFWTLLLGPLGYGCIGTSMYYFNQLIMQKVLYFIRYDFAVILGCLFTFTIFMSVHEGINTVTQSWIYNTPGWLVMMGWAPLVAAMTQLPDVLVFLKDASKWLQLSGSAKVRKEV